jgi:hypothetical protein
MMQIQTNDVEVPDFFVTVLADDGGVDFPSNSSSDFENKLCRDISIPDGLYECGVFASYNINNPKLRRYKTSYQSQWSNLQQQESFLRKRKPLPRIMK